jgi:predicted esterase
MTHQHSPSTSGVTIAPPLPSILCLHGGGTNSTIFNIQTIRLQRALSQHFNFVFLDAPFPALPGPGVLPIFEGCGPFLRWTKAPTSNDLPEETRTLITNACKETEFVGVLGFSQGAKLASGLLLEQHVRGTNGFKFGVLLMGTSPPLTAGLTAEERRTRVGISSVVVLGKEDPWCEEGRRLYEEFWEREKATLVELDIGHRLPTLEKETEMIVDEILRLYRETKEEP